MPPVEPLTRRVYFLKRKMLSRKAAAWEREWITRDADKLPVCTLPADPADVYKFSRQHIKAKICALRTEYRIDGYHKCHRQRRNMSPVPYFPQQSHRSTRRLLHRRRKADDSNYVDPFVLSFPIMIFLFPEKSFVDSENPLTLLLLAPSCKKPGIHCAIDCPDILTPSCRLTTIAAK